MVTLLWWLGDFSWNPRTETLVNLLRTQMRCWNPAKSPDDPPSATPSCFASHCRWLSLLLFVLLMREDHSRIPAFLTSHFKWTEPSKVESHIILKFLEEIWLAQHGSYFSLECSQVHKSNSWTTINSLRERNYYITDIYTKKKKPHKNNSAACAAVENFKVLELEELKNHHN